MDYSKTCFAIVKSWTKLLCCYFCGLLIITKYILEPLYLSVLRNNAQLFCRKTEEAIGNQDF